MKNQVLLGLAALLVVAILSGCGKKPQAEIDATNAAIEAAKTAEAVVYLPAEFASLQDSLNSAIAEIETQNSKLFRNFGSVEVKLKEIQAAANKVAEDAVVQKEEVKKEVEALMTEVKAVIEDNLSLMKKAPRGKEGAAVLEALKSDMSTIDTTITEAQGFYDKGAFMDAANKVKAAKERADAINTELKDAIAKVQARR